MLDKKMLILKAPRPDTMINVNICGGVFLSKKTTLLILFKCSIFVICLLFYWYIGLLAYWSTGILVYRAPLSAAELVYWSVRLLVYRAPGTGLRYRVWRHRGI